VTFLDRLFKIVYDLNRARPLREWNRILIEALQRFFAESEDTESEIQLLRRRLDALSQIETLSGFDKPVAIEVVVSFLTGLFEREQLQSGFISSGVTFCAMLPMRSIPFKVVCLIGMNSGDFPRKTITLAFDLMAANPKIGDRSKKKHQFENSFQYPNLRFIPKNRVYTHMAKSRPKSYPHGIKQKLERLRFALAPVQTRLSLPMVVALLTLAIEPGLSVNELADRTKTTQQSTSRYVSILMGRYDTDLFTSTSMQPLVAQEINAEDPRKRALFLTEAG